MRKALGVDLDGTLFRRVEGPEGRGPYDLTRVTEDLVNPHVARVIGMHQALGWAIVLLSGRDEVSRALTEHALVWGGVDWDLLAMRPEGDQRSDEIVKEELFHLWIEDNYDMELILDDRQRVVDMWRRLGIECWQTAPGNF